MRSTLLLLLIALSAHASNLLSSKIYDRENRVDLLLSFDTVYTGTVSRYERNGRTYLIVPNVNAPEDKHYTFAKSYLKKVTIYKSDNRTLIEVDAPDGAFEISKVPPGYGLRVRITKAKRTLPIAALSATAAQEAIPIPTVGKDVADLGEKYMIVALFVAALLLLALLLRYIARNRMGAGGKSAAMEARVLYSKPIDAKNRLLLIEFNDKHHLVLMGVAGNVLIDSVSLYEEKEGFEALLKENSNSLDRYLSGRDQQKKRPTKK